MGLAMRIMTPITLLTALSIGSMLPASAGDAPLKKSGMDKELVYYSGSITLSGTYERRLDEMTRMFRGDAICFFPAAESAKLIPRETGDRRMAWFCFENNLKATADLNIPATKNKDSCGFVGTATVVVSNYVANRKESGVHDLARLEKVISSSNPEQMPCPATPE